MLLKNTLTATALSLAVTAVTMNMAQAVPISADVITLVDESGSMSGEHAWLDGMITSLEAGLTGDGVGTGAQTNRYGLTGFGGAGTHFNPHKHGGLGTTAEFDTATNSLTLGGGTEDGWAAINFAANNYGFNSGAAVNMILVTDEDRDNTNNTLSYNSVLNDLTNLNALLNAVVNCEFSDDAGNRALGIDSHGFSYIADGIGGFTKSTGANVNTSNCSPGFFGSGTDTQYVDLALESGGAAWDLNLLRAGGLNADSFTAAFIDIKVEEIVNTSVPEPATLALFSLGLFGIGAVARRRKMS